MINAGPEDVLFTNEVDYTYDSELSNGGDLPSFMTKKTDGMMEWIETDSTEYTQAGKYVV